MSGDLHRAGSSFSKPNLPKETDYISLLGGGRSGRTFTYNDIAIRENDLAEPTRHRAGDLIIQCLGDELRFYRVDEKNLYRRMTVA